MCASDACGTSRQQIHSGGAPCRFRRVVRRCGLESEVQGMSASEERLRKVARRVQEPAHHQRTCSQVQGVLPEVRSTNKLVIQQTSEHVTGGALGQGMDLY